MELSKIQGEAVEKVVAWYNGGNSTPQVFRLFGYAGTGKTTLAKYIAQALDVEAVFATFTGKAASVLQKKGNAASTIHSLIYRLAKGDEELIRSLEKRIADETSEALKSILKRDLATATKPKFVLRHLDELEEISLIVIDEVSMVGEQIGQDLCSFGKKILVLGDPGQLPPIEGGGYFTAQQPDILLTEIHRQARDNPIITMATLVRQGHKLRPGDYGGSKVIRRNQAIDPRAWDQLIVGTNNSRRAWNARYRSDSSFDAACPQRGEKVICLRNNREAGILNGTQWKVVESVDRGYAYGLLLADWTEADRQLDDWLDAHPFTLDLKDEPYYVRTKYEEFDYGYAVTCHKAQGSQWDNVYIQDESWIFKENSAKWLYTALTRAAEKVLVAV